MAVIGAGSSGREAALTAAQHGLRVVLIEKDSLGGTCLHRGFYCLRALRACVKTAKYGSSSSSPDFGVNQVLTGLPDWNTNHRKLSTRLTLACKKQLERAGVETRFGKGTLIGTGRIGLERTGGQLDFIEADYIIVATGSRPEFEPRGSSSRLVNSAELLMRSDLPRHLLVVGGGYIGCEFASIFRSLGSRVTLVEQRGRLLPTWDEAVGNFIAGAMRAAGIELHLGFSLDASELNDTSEELAIMLGDGTRITPDIVLLANGRKPNVDDLGLERMDIVTNPFIVTNEQLRTSCDRVFAIGDVNGLSLLDSAAVTQARVAVDTMLGKHARFSARWIPRSIHTDPGAASIGWNEDEAVKAGLDVIAHSQTFRLVTDDKRTVVGPSETLLKILLRAGSRQILGVHAIGHQATEIVNFVSAAIRSELTVDKLLQVPLVHPSTAEAIQECAKGLARVSGGFPV